MVRMTFFTAEPKKKPSQTKILRQAFPEFDNMDWGAHIIALPFKVRGPRQLSSS